jgi:hypothetical protein
MRVGIGGVKRTPKNVCIHRIILVDALLQRSTSPYSTSHRVCASVSSMHGPDPWTFSLHLFPVAPGTETAFACGAGKMATARPCKCKREGAR